MPKEDEQAENARQALVYMNVLQYMMGCRVTAQLYERTTVSGTLRAVKGDSSEIILGDMQTFIGTVPNAIVRMSDVISIHCDSLQR